MPPVGPLKVLMLLLPFADAYCVTVEDEGTVEGKAGKVASDRQGSRLPDVTAGFGMGPKASSQSGNHTLPDWERPIKPYL